MRDLALTGLFFILTVDIILFIIDIWKFYKKMKPCIEKSYWEKDGMSRTSRGYDEQLVRSSMDHTWMIVLVGEEEDQVGLCD